MELSGPKYSSSAAGTAIVRTAASRAATLELDGAPDNPAAGERFAEPQIRILRMNSESDDLPTLRAILAGLPCQIASVSTCREGIEYLRSGCVTVIFCERLLEDGSWIDILEHIQQSAEPPLLIVTSRLADAYLWAEVLNLGGYDVLATPFNSREVQHVLKTISLHDDRMSPRTRAAGAT